MTKFKYELEIKGNPDQLKSIHDELVKIGRTPADALMNFEYLVTNRSGGDQMGFCNILSPDHVRISFNAEDKD